MLIPSRYGYFIQRFTSLSRRVNANSQHIDNRLSVLLKLIKKGEC